MDELAYLERGASADVEALFGAGKRAEAIETIIKLAESADRGAELGHQRVVDAAVRGLVTTLRLGNAWSEASDEWKPDLYRAVAGALWALGAALVRGEHWGCIGAIGRCAVTPGGHHARLLRQAQIRVGGKTPREVNVIDLGAGVLATHSGFGMQELNSQQRLMACTQFDFAAVFPIASYDLESGRADEEPGYFPSYAKFPSN